MSEIKVNSAILQNRVFWGLSDSAWRLYIELCLLTNEAEMGQGEPFQVQDLAWWLRRGEGDILAGLAELEAYDLVGNCTGAKHYGWHILPSQMVKVFDTSTSWTTVRKNVLERDNYTCVYCGQIANAADHIFPRSMGGRDSEDNLVAACKRCNSSKGDKLPFDWYKEQPYFSELRWSYVNAVQNGVIVTGGDAQTFKEGTF